MSNYNDSTPSAPEYVTRGDMEAYIKEKLSDKVLQQNIAEMMVEGLKPYAEIIQLQILGAIAKEMANNSTGKFVPVSSNGRIYDLNAPKVTDPYSISMSGKVNAGIMCKDVNAILSDALENLKTNRQSLM